MKEIIYNENNLKEDEINRVVKRAKAIIINSRDEFLLGRGENNYQLLGGHVEDDETFEKCLKREIKEESGIEIFSPIKEAFLVIKYFNKDYPEVGVNSLYIANYYIIHCDLLPDATKMHLTDGEKRGNFSLEYIQESCILKRLEESLKSCTKENVVKDTILVIREYLNTIKFKN